MAAGEFERLRAESDQWRLEADRLRLEADQLRLEVVALRAAVEALEVELERLRHEMGTHSGNSGKPPSSDTITQRAKNNETRVSRAERRREARAKAKRFLADKAEPVRNPGKQPGEDGVTLNQVADPDRVECVAPACCGGCGASLADAAVVATEVRQVFDLPARRLEVSEHQAQTRLCGCGERTKAQFPPQARSAACYGPLVRAVGVYLTAGQHLPVARAAELLAQVCGAPVSTGWLAGLAAEAADGLGGFIEVLKSQLRAEDVLHADETSARVSGACYWFHVACTDLFTLLDCHTSRGVAATTDIGVLGFFGGVLVTDGWGPYWSIDGLDHALCCAHLLRDLAALSESVSHRSWADAMADLLVEAKNTMADAVGEGRAGLTPGQLKGFRGRYTKILNQGRAAVPAVHHSGTINRAAHNLLNRLDTQRDEVTRYWTNPAVDFTNNQAERDLRMVKLQRKISGCFRTIKGAKDFCVIRSYLQTASKHGQARLGVLTDLFMGHPWMPPAQAP